MLRVALTGLWSCAPGTILSENHHNLVKPCQAILCIHTYARMELQGCLVVWKDVLQTGKGDARGGRQGSGGRGRCGDRNLDL